MGNYEYTSPDISISIVDTPAVLPIVTKNDISDLVTLISKELLDLSNSNLNNCYITIVTYFPNIYDARGNITTVGAVKSTETVPLTKKAILSQISDLEYKLLLYSNAATTKEELLLVSNTKETILTWKSALTAPIVVDPIIQIIPLDINDPDYSVIQYYMDYILSYRYISVKADWIVVYKYYNLITPVLDILKQRYVGDLTLISFEEVLTKTMAALKEYATAVPPTS